MDDTNALVITLLITVNDHYIKYVCNKIKIRQLFISTIF